MSHLLTTIRLCMAFMALTLCADIPNFLNHQGRVAVGGVAFTGMGQFKFALVNDTGFITYWSNDGTSVAGAEPTAFASLPVNQGLYSVRLGDSAVVNMSPLIPSIFNHPDLRLRIWFNNGTAGFQLLSPDHRLASVGYSMIAATLQPGATVTSDNGGPSLTLARSNDATTVLSLHTPYQTWWIGQNQPPDGLVYDNFYIYDQTADATRLSITTDGNVGIGTVIPTSKLDVVGTITATAFVGNGEGLTEVTVNGPINEPPLELVPIPGMAWLKPGRFIMGSHASEPGHVANEGPQTMVSLTRGFWMGVHEVTQGEYEVVMAINPSFHTGDTNRPVEQVSWNDAVAYCDALTLSERKAGRIPINWRYRLPTEAEWEYGCRAGSRTTRFGFGDDLGGTALTKYAWIDSNSAATTHPVEQKLANPWGLMDLHGNVWEWCQDWEGAYPGGSQTNPTGPASGFLRIIRGGSFLNDLAPCRTAYRASEDASAAQSYIGFRVVLASP